MPFRTILFLLTLATTLFCAAVNCYTYQIAYPLWSFVGPGEFRALHEEYLRRLSWIITVPHVLMFFSSAALIWRRPGSMALWQAVVLFALDAAVVAISAFLAGPLHDQLSRLGVPEQSIIAQLVRISLVRTVLMLAASVLVLTVAYDRMR